MDSAAEILAPAALVVGIVVGGIAGAAAVSWLARQPAAGPIALFIAAPLLPAVHVLGPLSLDDILPIVGLGILVTRIRPPTLTSSVLLRGALVAVLLITLARVISTLANADQLPNVTATLAVAVLRPLFLVAAAIGTAAALPREQRARFVGYGLAAIGTFEAVFSLITYAIPIEGLGNRPARLYESLATCDYRVTGTLGLSANHVGAVFVVTIPMTLGMAVGSTGRRRWLLALGAAVQCVALFLTFTRASIALAIVAGIAVLIYHRQVRLLLGTGAAALVLLAGFTTYACAAPVISPPPVVQPTPHPGDSGVVEPGIVDRFGDPSDRPALWYTAARMTIDYPAFGVGIGRMVDVMRGDPKRYIETPFGKATNSAHNTILLAGAETGLLGAISTLALNLVLTLGAMRLLWIGRRMQPIFAAAGFATIAFLVQGMLNNLFTVPATGTLLAVLVGAYATASASTHRQPDSLPPGPSVPPLAAGG